MSKLARPGFAVAKYWLKGGDREGKGPEIVIIGKAGDRPTIATKRGRCSPHWSGWPQATSREIRHQ